MEQIYWRLEAPSSERLRANHASELKFETEYCPITANHIVRSSRAGELALELKHNHRDEMMIWGWMGGCVVHEQLLDAYEGQGFTGYITRPATVRFRDGSVSNEYREFLVTGWGGMAAPASGVRLLEGCPACSWKKFSPIVHHDALIDWSQWSGDDFFLVWPLPGYTLVTERVAHWLQKQRIKSFRLSKLEEIPQIIAELGFKVGKLPAYFPPDLAIKYGRQIGIE